MRHHNVWARAVFVHAHGTGRLVGPHQAWLHVAQRLALGIGRQLAGQTDTDGDVAGHQHLGNIQVIDVLDHNHHPRRFLADGLEHGWQQAEFDVIAQADAEGHLADRRLEIGGQAQRRGHGVQRRREVLENFMGAGGGLHAMANPDEQRVIEQVAQAVQGGADRGLAEEQLFRCAGHVTFLHQGLKDDHQIDVGLAQLISIHCYSLASGPAAPDRRLSLGKRCRKRPAFCLLRTLTKRLLTVRQQEKGESVVGNRVYLQVCRQRSGGSSI
ncbi:hypothetical protein A245_22944 [Pseudomonas syringae pv. actinidiae ICMP 19096]|uniref:Uncharacterized protein n=1 Tax=Pseudomonas syringae pv. actinidiae ICMP 19096 TaxID=1194405 RepID=A0A656JV17_PSESF|nr:hypothetical protein A245_22944 [Pseudomonas syringae pv. actinidiae ICMP 19096]